MGSATSGLIGRDAELTLGRSVVETVVGGASAMLRVEGEAGIGKSELVLALVTDAFDRGVRVLRAGAHPFSSNRPYGVVADALGIRKRSSDPRRAAIADLLGGATGTDARYLVVSRIIDLVESLAADCALMVVFEDLHWADESSLVAIGSVMHELRHVPVLQVCTLRPAPRTSALTLLLDDAAAAGAQTVVLPRLSATDVERLLTIELGDRPGPLLTSIVDKAAGNPLWVLEMVRSLSGEGWLRREGGQVEAAGNELPGSFRELVLRRLGYLPSAALELLRVASVLGEAVSIHDLAVVTGRSSTAVAADLDEAFRARLLDEHAATLVFRHQLVQQAIYEDLPEPTRRTLHREVAGALAAAGADLSQVASHLVRGADRGDLEAVRLLRLAAAEAVGGAPAVAAELLGCAHDLLPTGHEEAEVIRSDLATAMLQAGLVAEAAALAQSTLDVPHRNDVDLPLRLTLVSCLSLLNRGSELVQRAEEALRSAPLDVAQQALILTQQSYGQTFSGDFAGGEATARRAFELAGHADDAEMAVWSRGALSVAIRGQGRYAEALAHSEEAVARAFEPVHHGARLRHPHFFLAMALADADRIAEARKVYARAIEEAEELGTAWLLPDMLHLSAEAHFLAGAWDDAAADLEAGLTLSITHGQQISIAQSHAYQALMAAGRGELEAAEAALAPVAHVLTSDVPVYGAELAAFAVSVLAEAKGDRHRALAVLARAWDDDVARNVRYYHRYLGPALVRLALELDQLDLAADVAATVEQGAALAPEVPTVQSAAMRCRGLVDHDASRLVEAVGSARRGGRILDHGGACEDAASALAPAGRPNEAIELLLEAQARYESADARAWVARVAAKLRALGVRQGARGQRRRSTSGWASLTDSERAVAALVAEGLTNRATAQRLHISPHTVNTHLRHLFQKLSVSTRTELATKVHSSPQITRSSDVSEVGDGAD